MKKSSFLLLLISLSIGACSEAGNNNSRSNSESTSKPISAPAPKNVTGPGWAKNLRDLQSAFAKQDATKLKTYFSFPINADTTQVWEAIYDQISQAERPNTFPSTFTERDFDRHYKTLFSNDLVTAIADLNVDELVEKGEYTTPKYKKGGSEFYLIASLKRSASMLQLTVSYPGPTDENGNYVSEGEYAVIYFFKMVGRQRLQFDKVLFAG